MSETYCGKDCASCGSQQTDACPGCKTGPGRSIVGDCDLARCCREKGHETCDTCAYRSNCWTLRERDTLLEKRIRKQEWDAQQKQNRVRKSALLGKWSWYLFWLAVPALLAGLMTTEEIVDLLPGLKMPGQLLSLVLSLAYGLILLKMAPEEPRFRTAAWCTLGVAATNGFLELVCGLAPLPLLLSLPLAAVSLVGTYQEFRGFGDALSGVDNALSGKWDTLWKWYIGSYGVMLGSIILMLLSVVLGLLAILASAIAQVVIGILQMIYTYRAAKAFQYYAG